MWVVAIPYLLLLLVLGGVLTIFFRRGASSYGAAFLRTAIFLILAFPLAMVMHLEPVSGILGLLLLVFLISKVGKRHREKLE